MAYSQDTIVSANAGNALVEKIKPILTSGGWVLEDSMTPSGTFRTEVYKSPGASNASGADWFVALLWNTVGTEHLTEIIAGRTYVKASKTLGQIPYTERSSVNATGVLDGGYTNAHVVNRVTPTSDSGSDLPRPFGIGSWFREIVPSSAFAYWLSVTPNHFTLYSTMAGSAMTHNAVLQISAEWAAQPWTNKQPIVSTRRSRTLNQRGAVSSAVNSFSGTGVTIVSTSMYSWGAQLPLLQSNYLPASAWRPTYYLTSVQYPNASTQPHPSFAQGMVIGTEVDAYNTFGGAVGDTVVVDNQTYVLSEPVGPVTNDGSPSTTVLVKVE